MELKKAWDFVYDYLKQNGIDEPSDVDLIFGEVLQKNRAEIKLIKEISISQFDEIMIITKKRATHLPLQRIFGKTNFFGLDFNLNDDTLIPRFDTEILVEKVVKFIKNQKRRELKVLDLCTGTGCIAISIAKNTDAVVTAVDVNENALSMAKFNAKQNGVNVNFLLSDMFQNIPLQQFDIIVSNPPYIKSGDIPYLDPTVKDFEPYLALNGGEDGLYFYNVIAENAFKYLVSQGKVFMEIGEKQAQSVANIFNLCYTDIEIVKDLHKNDRVIIASSK